MKTRTAAVIIGLVAVIASIWITILNSRITIDYCKSIIRTDGKIVLICEKDTFTSIIAMNENGAVLGRINTVTTRPLPSSVRSFHNLFSDENGDIYVCCNVYKKDAQFEEIYKCNFEASSLKKIWTSRDVDGYTFAKNSIPSISNGEIFTVMNGENGTDVLGFSDREGYSAAVFDVCGDGAFDRIFFKDGNVFALASNYGVFVNGEKIYPCEKNAGILNGLNYENGILSFIDISEKKLVNYDMMSGTLTEFQCGYDALDSIQGVTVYYDGTMTASLENGDELNGVICGSSDIRVFQSADGFYSLLGFGKTLLFDAALIFVLFVLYHLVFVRRKKQNDHSAIRYQGIAAKVTAISTAASLVLGTGFAAAIYKTENELSEYWQNAAASNSSYLTLGYLFTDFSVEIESGTPSFKDEDYPELKRIISDYQSSVFESNISVCDVNIFAVARNKVYCIYSGDYNGALPAEYTISINAEEIVGECIKEMRSGFFEEKRASGRFRYTLSPVLFGIEEENVYVQCVFSLVSDAYNTKLAAVQTAESLTAAVFGIVFFLLLSANIVLRLNLKKLKRLKNAFDLYRENAEPNVFDITGGDEIASTGQALKLMTEGIRIHTRDISRGNQKYKRLIPAGIMSFLEEKEVSKVRIGTNTARNVLLIRFVMNCGFDTELEKIGDLVRECGGYLLNISDRKADLCVVDEDMYTAAISKVLQVEYPGYVLISLGKVEAGSAGDEANAWLIALSIVFSEFDKISANNEQPPGIIANVNLSRMLNKFTTEPVVIQGVEYIRILPNDIGENDGIKTFDSVADTTADTNVDGAAVL